MIDERIKGMEPELLTKSEAGGRVTNRGVISKPVTLTAALQPEVHLQWRSCDNRGYNVTKIPCLRSVREDCGLSSGEANWY